MKRKDKQKGRNEMKRPCATARSHAQRTETAWPRTIVKASSAVLVVTFATVVTICLVVVISVQLGEQRLQLSWGAAESTGRNVQSSYTPCNCRGEVFNNTTQNNDNENTKEISQ
jgi:hypothetical protein